MKKDEITVECEGNPLMEKILQNAIKLKKGQAAFLPHELPQDAFDELAAFSYKYFEEEKSGDKLCYEAIFICVTQIFDHQQNPYKHGEIKVHEDKIHEAINSYCMWLQFELISRTESLGITISPPTLNNIFDGNLAFDVRVRKSLPSIPPEEVKNLSPKMLAGIKHILKGKKPLNSLDDDQDTTVH